MKSKQRYYQRLIGVSHSPTRPICSMFHTWQGLGSSVHHVPLSSTHASSERIYTCIADVSAEELRGAYSLESGLTRVLLNSGHISNKYPSCISSPLYRGIIVEIPRAILQVCRMGE